MILLLQIYLYQKNAAHSLHTFEYTKRTAHQWFSKRRQVWNRLSRMIAFSYNHYWNIQCSIITEKCHTVEIPLNISMNSALEDALSYGYKCAIVAIELLLISFVACILTWHIWCNSKQCMFVYSAKAVRYIVKKHVSSKLCNMFLPICSVSANRG